MSVIAAISTSPGIGGISIIRMSGKEVFEVLNKIFKPKNEGNIKGYNIKYGNIIENGNIVDEVLVSYFLEPNSYTTENMCEINSHGGNVIAKRILELCLKNGAILAQPGEFTKKAFLNGRIDLSQAESVIDIINAKTSKEASVAIEQLEGNLSKNIKDIKSELLSAISDIEATIDYPEYDIEEQTTKNITDILGNIKNKLLKLENSFNNGKILKDGIDIAIIGKPNVGKSSLLNYILNEERAIVTDVEGTTRDTIEETISIDGIPFKIIDTAGIRNSQNKIENIGIEKSKNLVKKVELIIAIFDCNKLLDEEDEEILELIKNKNAIIVLNKIDLEKNTTRENKKIKELNKPIVEISTLTGEGIEKIYNEIVKMFNTDKIKADNETVITNIRHKEVLSKAIEYIDSALKIIEEKKPIDITSMYIREAIQEINKITGENVTDDIINEIFSKFCLGK